MFSEHYYTCPRKKIKSKAPTKYTNKQTDNSNKCSFFTFSLLLCHGHIGLLDQGPLSNHIQAYLSSLAVP